MDLNLKQHVALVTGGASGIGRAAAKMFANEGCHVAIWDTSDAVKSVAQELADSTKLEVRGFQVDVTNAEQVAQALADTELQLGPVDHLTHAVAIGSGKFGFPYTKLAASDWRRVLEVNVMGMTNVAHALGPRMQERGRGTMVFLASVAGQIGSQTDPPYSASKAANINFAQCIARDLAPAGVRVNTICPGMVQTPLNRSVWQAWYDQQAPADRRSYEDWGGEKVRKVVPLGQWQQPEDIANMIVFLSSDRTAHVTGQTINVDGGFVMHW